MPVQRPDTAICVQLSNVTESNISSNPKLEPKLVRKWLRTLAIVVVIRKIDVRCDLKKSEVTSAKCQSQQDAAQQTRWAML